ncbi:MAG: prepilin peptidase [Methanoregula sp.]|jgi:prepilin signal peptidase PulO-like enzyme (type II secretory pathway)|nr:prepilin peptidase [Methanoregula sp.]
MHIFLIFIFGLCFGSFLNCFIYRLHEKKTILGRSFCPSCHKQIAWYDNIPLVSFILLKGKCRHCKRKISWQYPAVELATAVLFVLIYINAQFSITNAQSISNIQYPISNIILFARNLIFICALIIIFIYDLRWQLILDKITLPAMAVALGLNLCLGMGWLNLLIAAGVGGGFFLAQYLISRGRWIGGGDISLGILMGIILGWPQILTALFLAYVSGAIIGAGLLAARKKQWSSQIPFGTFLSAATIVTLLWGNKILEWYLNLIF